jgi:hypothetical protein
MMTDSDETMSIKLLKEVYKRRTMCYYDRCQLSLRELCATKYFIKTNS